MSQRYSFQKIEKKWQDKWEEEKVFEAEVDKKKEKFFVSFPYPYVNLSPHMGHFYSAMRTESFARYKRLQGFNVLFAQGWHATGSPIIGAAERVKEKEPKQLEALKKEGFSEKELKKFEKPEHWIRVFGKRWHEHFSMMGMSIDWRRNFITTSLNPHYDRFIKWQFMKLKEKDYVGKGKHPVVWDPKTNMPVGDHDRVKGEGVVPQEFCLFKFKLNDKINLITATLRHDTVLGITNVYIHPDIEYSEVKVNEETWIIAQPMIEKLKNQEFKVEEVKKIKGKDLVGKKVESIFGEKILVLPAYFLDENIGTGIVHSVPSDSADDLIALYNLKNNEEIIKEFNLDKEEIKKIKPVEIFNTPEIKGNAAKFFLEKYNVKSQKEESKLAKIRKELYTFTFNKSKFNELYRNKFSKNLEGKGIEEGQEIIKNDLVKEKRIEIFYELTEEVVSRSLTRCIVKIVSDQWFIKYGNKKWKKEVHDLVNEMKFYPEIIKKQFQYVVDWLRDWACTREYGLGTRLPFDENWLIESLSDSTIYMAYYTLAHIIKEINPEDLTEEFFDYVFLDKDRGKKEWKKYKEEFEYWYPHDFRNSGKDLIQNHLTFFLFNHVAVFPKKYWPKSIGANGWVKVDGQKMSKSLGNLIPLKEMAEKFGADASRLTILNGGEGMDDPNWDSGFAAALESKFNSMFNLIIENYSKGRKEVLNVDNWMESKTNSLVKEITNFMEETMFRSSIQKIFFEYRGLIKTYLDKTNNNPNKKIFQNSVKNYLVMLSVFCPHISEELWEKLGNKNFISFETWPKPDESKIDENLEKQEQQVEKLTSDINHIVKLVREKESKKVKKCYVYVLPNEKENYIENLDLIKKKTNLEVDIFAVNDKDKYDPENKSKKVKPGRPGIYLE